MINPQAIEPAGSDQIEDQAVGLVEDLDFFHAQSGQIIDIKKTPVVYFIGRNPPESQAIWLLFQQQVEQVKAFRPAHQPIK